MWGKREDMIVHGWEPFNAEPPRLAMAHDALTDEKTFFVRNHGPVPVVDPQGWRLSVQGRDAQPLELSLRDLQSWFDAHTVVATLQCAGNRRAGLMRVRDIPGETPWGPGATATATWTGARLRDVLHTAGLSAADTHVAFEAPDVSGIPVPPQRFGASIPISKALGEEVVLAWAMNDAPLSTVHGAPVRVVVPGYIGARSVKWVERITMQERPSDNFFQATAYRLLPPDADPANAGHGDGLSLGPIAVNSDILSPDDGSTHPAGTVTVRGYALAGNDRRVARVDVSLNNGRSWRQAELDDQLSPWTWRRWYLPVTLPPGEITITVRAWDTAAAVQPESAAQLWNPKGYVNNSWARVHVTARDSGGQARAGALSRW